MLQNAYFLAKIGPKKNRYRYSRKRATFCRILPRSPRCRLYDVRLCSAVARGRRSRRRASRRGRSGAGPHRRERSRRAPQAAGVRVSKISKIGKFFTEVCKFLAGSISAVSKRKIACEYSSDSIFQTVQGGGGQGPAWFAPTEANEYMDEITSKL